MIRRLLFSIGLAAAATGVLAQAPSDQLLANVSRELPSYVQGVDARTLRRSQLAAIYAIMHGGGSGGDKKAAIRSVIGGRFSLRGLLFGQAE